MEPIAKYRNGFYFEQLNIDEQWLYRKIAGAVARYEDEVDIAEQNPKVLHHVLMAVKYDNPEFFYWCLDNGSLKDGKICFCYLTKTREEAVSQVHKLREKRREILAQLIPAERVEQMELLRLVYGYLVEHVAYASDELQKPSSYPWIYDIRGPMLKGRGVCLGIAMAMNYLCMPLHMETLLITGEADVAGERCKHGWNLVKMNDTYCHLDVTCEICEKADHDGSFQYFMVKDSALSGRNWAKSLYPEVSE